jgi:hypothetical protein
LEKQLVRSRRPPGVIKGREHRNICRNSRKEVEEYLEETVREPKTSWRNNRQKQRSTWQNNR